MAVEENDNDEELDAMHERIDKLRRDLRALVTLERGADVTKHDAIEPPRKPIILDPGKNSGDS